MLLVAENRFCVPLLLAGLLVLSVLLHFAWFTYPMTVVLDEVHYGRFAMAAMRHEFFFDIHPPLGKLLYWTTGVMAGLDPSFTFPGNQVPLPDASYLALRALPRLVGTFFPLLMFGVARELGMSVRAALMVALLVMFENATELISQFVLIDIFLLAFGFTAVWAYLRYKNTARIPWLFLAGIAAGCAISTKWTGLTFCVLMGCLELIHFIRNRSWLGLCALLVLGILPLIVYVATFAMQFALVTQYSAAAQTFSPGFRASLSGSPEQISNIASNGVKVAPTSFVERFVELNQSMFESAHQIQTEHPYSSKWYSWPFMTRGLDFWADAQSEPEAGVTSGTINRFAHIMLLGNPIVWWVSTYAILLLLINLPPQLLKWLSRGEPPEPNTLFLCAAYVLNLLPFVGIARVMFLYHYLSALMFAVLALCWQLDRAQRYRWLMPALLAAAITAFIFFAPFTYGLHLSKSGLDAHFWLDSWR